MANYTKPHPCINPSLGGLKCPPAHSKYFGSIPSTYFVKLKQKQLTELNESSNKIAEPEPQKVSNRSYIVCGSGKSNSFASGNQKPPVYLSPCASGKENGEKTTHFYKRSRADIESPQKRNPLIKHVRDVKADTAAAGGRNATRCSSLSRDNSGRGKESVKTFVPGKIFSQTPTTNVDMVEIELKKPKESVVDSFDASQAVHIMNIIAELRKELSDKELEVLKLKNENMKAEMATEDCRRELRLQSKELETLKSHIKDQRGLCKHCVGLLKPFVLEAKHAI